MEEFTMYEKAYFANAIKYDYLDNVYHKLIGTNSQIIMYVNIETIAKPMYKHNTSVNNLALSIMILNIVLHYRHFFNNIGIPSTFILYTHPDAYTEYHDTLGDICRMIKDIHFIGTINVSYVGNILYYLIENKLNANIYPIILSSRLDDHKIHMKQSNTRSVMRNKKLFLWNINNLYSKFIFKCDDIVIPNTVSMKRKQLFLYPLLILNGAIRDKDGKYTILGIFKGMKLVDRIDLINKILKDETHLPNKIQYKICSNITDLNKFNEIYTRIHLHYYESKSYAKSIRESIMNNKVRFTKIDDLKEILKDNNDNIELKIEWLIEKI